MISAKPGIVREIYIHSSYNDESGAELEKLCAKNNIAVKRDDKIFARINHNQKENCYVLGAFEKYSCALDGAKPHIVLVNPSDMGNLGTIIRIIAGFNICNLALVTPCADIFNPKTVRASMGALFHINFQKFGAFGEYANIDGSHSIFPFMLNADTALAPDNCPMVQNGLFSLVFGNESAGLDEASYSKAGRGVKIPQSEFVDSLNLSVAVGIGAFIFASNHGLIK
jgi:TrmH family RNA methyltransferase